MASTSVFIILHSHTAFGSFPSECSMTRQNSRSTHFDLAVLSSSFLLQETPASHTFRERIHTGLLSLYHVFGWFLQDWNFNVEPRHCETVSTSSRPQTVSICSRILLKPHQGLLTVIHPSRGGCEEKDAESVVQQ